MNNIVSLGPLTQKRTEGVQTYSFVLLRDNQTYKLVVEHKYEASFAVDGSLVKSVLMQANEDRLTFSSNQLLDLPAGDYQLEIREIIDDKIHAIYPSDRSLTFHIKQNNTDLPAGTVSSLTLDEFVSEFKRLIKTNSGGTGADVSIDVNKRIITVNDESLTIPEAVDVSKFASKADLQGLAKQIAGADTAARRGPTGFYLDRTTDPMRYVFDNGCTLTLKSGFGNTIADDGFSTNEYATSIGDSWPLANSIMSYAHGTVTSKIIEDTHSSPYAVYNGVVITDPINDATVWDWDNVFFNDKDRQDFLASPIGMWGGHTDYQKYGEREYIKMLYSLGLMNDDQIKSFGAVKKEG